MKSNQSFLNPSYDPYDPWMGPNGVAIRTAFYRGKLSGKILAALTVLVDWLFPMTLRRVLGIKPRNYPISVAQEILSADSLEDPSKALQELMSTAVPLDKDVGAAWGLGFPWMSKNGLYNENVPFITHTPYAMEALRKLMQFDECEQEAREHFQKTWVFLESLFILHDDDTGLALSYAPLEEPRIVINANSYACYAYCLHGLENKDHCDQARSRARRIAQYVISQQQEDGSWFYYADSLPGNFIDCFHSCFVLKNLIKASKLDDEIRAMVSDTIIMGKRYIDDNFFDENMGLVKRFTQRDIKDPFMWDLYDQAEYLGILIDMNEVSKAKKLSKVVKSNFFHQGVWSSKLDLLGRRWGKNFSRWGITPYLYSEARLNKLI
jgi:hypothetical protein